MLKTNLYNLTIRFHRSTFEVSYFYILTVKITLQNDNVKTNYILNYYKLQSAFYLFTSFCIFRKSFFKLFDIFPIYLFLLSLYPCIPVSLYLCIPVSLYPCIPVSLYPCIPISLYLCIPVSLYLCIPVSLYLCISVSLYWLVYQ